MLHRAALSMEQGAEGEGVGAEEGVPPEQPYLTTLRRWLSEHQRSALEASVLEACHDAGRDEALFVEELQGLKSTPEVSSFFETLPVVVVVNGGEGGAGFTCNDGLVVEEVRPGSACQRAGVQAGWHLDGFQRKPIATPTNWRAVVSSVSAAPHPWRFRFLSPAQKAAKQEARAACLGAIERLGHGRLRVLQATPYYDVPDADNLDRAARAQPTGRLSLGEFTRVLCSAVTDAGGAFIKHRLGWSAITDAADQTACFEKLQAKDEPSLAFARAAARADNEESRRVRVIRRLPCYEAPGAGQLGNDDLRVGSVVVLEDVVYTDSRPGGTGGSTMFVRHGQQQHAWSPCLSAEGAHAFMPWSAAEQGLDESIALAVLGRTSEDADEVGGGSTGLAANLVEVVARAHPTKSAKRQPSQPELAAAIAALLQQRVRSSADQCPPLVQSVLKCLRLVIEVLEIEERAAFEEQQAASKKKAKRGAPTGELSRALRRTMLGLVEELQFFEDAEAADKSFLHATARTCQRQLKRVDEARTGGGTASALNLLSPRETVLDMRDSVQQTLEMAEEMQGDWIAESIHAGLDLLEQSDRVAQVTSQTGAGDADARRCLDATGWDVHAASNYFFDLEEQALLAEMGLTEPEPEPEAEQWPDSKPESFTTLTESTRTGSVRQRFSSVRKSKKSGGATDNAGATAASPSGGADTAPSLVSRDPSPDEVVAREQQRVPTEGSASNAGAIGKAAGTGPVESEFESAVLARLKSAAAATDAGITLLPSNIEGIHDQAARDEAQLRLIEERRCVGEVGIFLKSREDGDVTDRMIKALRGAEYGPGDWLPVLQSMEMTDYKQLVGTCRTKPGDGAVRASGK